MVDAAAAPPDPDLDRLDPEALKKLVKGQRGEITHLRLMVQKLQRMLFGRRSEKYEPQEDQLLLLGEAAQLSFNVQPPAEPAVKSSSVGARKSRRCPSICAARSVRMLRITLLARSAAGP